MDFFTVMVSSGCDFLNRRILSHIDCRCCCFPVGLVVRCCFFMECESVIAAKVSVNPKLCVMRHGKQTQQVSVKRCEQKNAHEMVRPKPKDGHSVEFPCALWKWNGRQRSKQSPLVVVGAPPLAFPKRDPNVLFICIHGRHHEPKFAIFADACP